MFFDKSFVPGYFIDVARAGLLKPPLPCYVYEIAEGHAKQQTEGGKKSRPPLAPVGSKGWAGPASPYRTLA